MTSTAAIALVPAAAFLAAREAIRAPAVAAVEPSVRVPDDVIAHAGAQRGVRVSYHVSAADNAGNPLVPACRPSSGALFKRGTTRVLCSATDAAGKRADARFHVTVLGGGMPQPPDHKRPALTVPDDFRHEAPTLRGARVTYAASARDARDGALTPPACRPPGASSGPGARASRVLRPIPPATRRARTSQSPFERRLEAALVRAVQSQLDADPAVDSTRREARAREDGWTRRPGGVDLLVDAGGCRAGLEFKLDHADQCLWDALKLCGESFDLRALVVEAADYVWRDPSRAGTESLAPGDTLVTWKTTELIARWPVAWRDLDRRPWHPPDEMCVHLCDRRRHGRAACGSPAASHTRALDYAT